MQKNTSIEVKISHQNGLYVGQVQSGMMNGDGILKTDKLSCEGYFFQGNPVGHVILRKEGQIIRAVETGFTDLKSDLDSAGEWIEYSGNIHDGMASGPGKLLFQSGLSYEGTFQDGVPVGRGKLTASDGSYLEGVFVSSDQPSTEWRRFNANNGVMEILKSTLLGDSQPQVVSSLQLTPALELTVSCERYESVPVFNKNLIQTLLNQLNSKKKPVSKPFSSSAQTKSAFKRVQTNCLARTASQLSSSSANH